MADENEVVELDEEENPVDANTLEEFMEEQKRAAEAMRLPQAPIDRIIKEMLPNGMHASKVGFGCNFSYYGFLVYLSSC